MMMAPGVMLPMKVIVDPQKDAFIQFVESPKNKESRIARKNSSPCAIIPTGFGKEAQDRCIAASALALDQSHRVADGPHRRALGLRPRTYSAPLASSEASCGSDDPATPAGLRTRGLTVGDLTCETRAEEDENTEPSTTVMLRNLPQYFTRASLLELIDEAGFFGSYDFVYLPTDFNSQAGLGYAFVNLMGSDAAARFWAHFDNFSAWPLESAKVLDAFTPSTVVSPSSPSGDLSSIDPGATPESAITQVCCLGWSRPHQGLSALIERYRNSPVMHESLPDECKPMVFVNGARVSFPPPTRHVKWPRPRSTLSSGRAGDPAIWRSGGAGCGAGAAPASTVISTTLAFSPAPPASARDS